MSISVITIEDARFNPASNKFTRAFYEVPEVYEPQPGRNKPIRSNYLTGVQSNVPRNHFLASLLILNEINACKGAPIQRDSLRRQMLREYPDKKASVLKYFNKFAEKRKAFNQGILYHNQPRSPFYSWLYNDAGYIYHPIAKTIMGFEDCLLELKAYGVVDPRFHYPKEIANFRDMKMRGIPKALKMFIPSQEDIDRLVKTLFPKHEPLIKTEGDKVWDCRCPLYNCIKFPEGYGPGYK